jgi:hypothetical protein
MNILFAYLNITPIELTTQSCLRQISSLENFYLWRLCYNKPANAKRNCKFIHQAA